jgi:hypothetical protein
MVEQRKMWIAIILLFLFAGISAFLAWNGAGRAHVIVEWTTASELNTAGFNIYRGLSPEEYLSQLNAQLIPSSSDALSGGRYQYEDKSAVPNLTYYYYIEEVDLSGVPSRFGPIKIQAKGAGKAEGWLAVILTGFGLAGLAWWVVWARRKGRR